MVYGIRHFQQYFSYIWKPPTCCKSLTNFIREEYLNELYFVGNCMHTELYLFNVFTLFQDTETVSEHDLSMICPSMEPTSFTARPWLILQCFFRVCSRREEPIVERYVHIFATNAFLATVLFVNFKNEHFSCFIYACCFTLPSFLLNILLFILFQWHRGFRPSDFMIEDQPVTFDIVEVGTIRRAKKLVSSGGYSYTVKVYIKCWLFQR